MKKKRARKKVPEEHIEMAITEFASTILIAFRNEDPPRDSRKLVVEAVLAYFEAKPDEMKILEEWAEGGCFEEWEDSIWVKPRIFAMVKFCKEEMNLEWVSERTRFAYDYSSFK